MRAEPRLRDVRLAVHGRRRGSAPGSTPKRSSASSAARASGANAKQRVRHHVADDLDPAGDALARAASRRERSSGQSRSCASRSTSIRLRSSGIAEVAAAQARLDVRDRHARLGGRARAGERRVRVAVDEHPVRALGARPPARIAGCIAPDVRRAQVEPVAPARRARAPRRRRCDSSSSQCCPVWTTTSSMPAVAQRDARAGADLMNCGRLPTTESTFIGARLDEPFLSGECPRASARRRRSPRSPGGPRSSRPGARSCRSRSRS